MLEYSENNEYKATDSRYKILRKITDDTDTSYLETQNQRFVPNDPGDTYYKVGHAETNRLDIIANTCYGNYTLWWAIALANEIIDPFSVPEGSILRIPSLTSLYSIKNQILTR